MSIRLWGHGSYYRRVADIVVPTSVSGGDTLNVLFTVIARLADCIHPSAAYAANVDGII